MSASDTQTARIRWEEHQGSRILMLDFSKARPEESLAIIADFCELVDQEPDHSVLMITDVTSAEYDGSIATRWKAARMERNHKIRRSAVFGLHGLVEVAIRAFHHMLELLGKKENFKICRDKNECLAWLLKA